MNLSFSTSLVNSSRAALIIFSLFNLIWASSCNKDSCEKNRDHPRSGYHYDVLFDTVFNWSLPSKMRYYDLLKGEPVFVDISASNIQSEVQEISNPNESDCKYIYVRADTKGYALNGSFGTLQMNVKYFFEQPYASSNLNVSENFEITGNLNGNSIFYYQPLRYNNHLVYQNYSYRDSVRVQSKWYKDVFVFLDYKNGVTSEMFYSPKFGLLKYHDDKTYLEIYP